ncbi:hypothetical protein [Sphaerisporangium sp. TRM90804]|uniref:hypothetical protein n=1 Tax=Sphaerisporangium sp. TRM90804 TaxID=3031113 RepID=UPI00244B38EE|nr:hypothetical protein [Sphaerisporangium sp. TRM90804]MDH2427947.1 hypothetical protein [Sphaerisporangium sp. TRM90804]
MSEPQIDPAGNTQAFKAFAQNQEPEAAKPQRPSYLVPAIAAVAAVIVVAVVVFLLLR